MYCSYECAGVPEPSQNIQDAPRQCITGSPARGYRFKRKYDWPGEVPDNLKKDTTLSVYQCNYCLYWHVGHDFSESKELKGAA
jgi:hypothetical protein